jgi:DNA-binding Xre family transcriptional regulator
MAQREYRSISRGRRLTKVEASKYRKIRKQVENEFRPVKPNAMKVAIAKLRAMREAKGVTLAELSARTGMSRGNIARLETQKNATLRTLERYAAGLGCVLEIGFMTADVKSRKKAHAAG